MLLPRPLNVRAIGRCLGEFPFQADVEMVRKRIVDYFSQVGPYSYDPVRKEYVGVRAGQTLLQSALARISTTGKPIGRQPNADLLRFIVDEFGIGVQQIRPLRPAQRLIAEGWIIRLSAFHYALSGEKAFLQEFNFSKTIEVTPEQARFELSVYRHSLLKGDLAELGMEIWDLSRPRGELGRVVRRYDSDSLSLASKAEVDRVLTIYKTGYELAHTKNELPVNAYRRATNFEESLFR